MIAAQINATLALIHQNFTPKRIEQETMDRHIMLLESHFALRLIWR